MKKTAIIITLLLGFTAKANVTCTKEGRYWMPTNQVAKDIAKALKVKTCNGKRFNKMVAKLGMTSNAVLSSSFNEASLLKKYKK